MSQFLRIAWATKTTATKTKAKYPKKVKDKKSKRKPTAKAEKIAARKLTKKSVKIRVIRSKLAWPKIPGNALTKENCPITKDRMMAAGTMNRQRRRPISTDDDGNDRQAVKIDERLDSRLLPNFITFAPDFNNFSDQQTARNTIA